MNTAENPAVEAQYRQELDRLLNSEMFRHSESVSKLLEYLGCKSLAGDESSLKEFAIGVDASIRRPITIRRSIPWSAYWRASFATNWKTTIARKAPLTVSGSSCPRAITG
jgi:hypothetical protein